MESVNGIRFNSALPVSEFARFLPEPKSRVGAVMGNVLSTVGSLMAGGATQFSGIDPTYMELLNQQIEVQQQMQLISMHSNIEKSKHETQMAAIRNLRVG